MFKPFASKPENLFVIYRNLVLITDTDARYQTRSTLLTSQLPVPAWYAQIGDPTIADSILDRLVHNAHRLKLNRESMRKKKGKSEGGEQS